jgi:hypothetical protein
VSQETGGAGDEQLAVELAELLRRFDPVPDRVLDAARASLGWRTLEADLAQLIADSRLATGAAVRGEPPRLLTFQAGDRITIELEVSELGDQHGGRLRVLGQLVPPRPARIRAERPDGTVEVAADPLGRFALRDLSRGPLRLTCRPLGPDGEPEGAEAHTEWLVL